MTETIILGSENSAARGLLAKAGVAVTVMAADLDDQALGAPLEETGAAPEDVALVRAEAKAIEVSEQQGDSLVLGCEQTLALGDELLHAPADMDEARRRLLLLSGRVHQVSSAAVLARNGAAVWRNTGVATLTMRKLDPRFIGRYVTRVEAPVLRSPGVYRIDGEGIQLFETIDGDYFTIAGLPLLPLLAELRRLRAIDG